MDAKAHRTQYKKAQKKANNNIPVGLTSRSELNVLTMKLLTKSCRIALKGNRNRFDNQAITRHLTSVRATINPHLLINVVMESPFLVL